MLKAVMMVAAAGMVAGGVAVEVVGAPVGALVAGQRRSAPDCPNLMPGRTPSLTCSCMGTGSSGTVWGTDIYTADSNICMAAQHADAIDENGVVTVFSAPGRASYRGSVRNDIETADWDSFSRSITFRPAGGSAGYAPPVALAPRRAPECPRLMPARTQSLTCNCMTSGSSGTVWGTNVYTADSDICLAAQHAGAVRPNGDVTVDSAPGRRRYFGSVRNDIETANWGAFSRSIVFRRQP